MMSTFSDLVTRVTALQEDVAAAKHARSISESRCDSLQKQLDGATVRLEESKIEAKDAWSQYRQETELLRSKVESLEQARIAAGSHAETTAQELEQVLATRAQALRTSKENCRRTEHELALKTEECKRLQEQQKTFAALMGALEAEHRKMNTSLMEGRKLVKGNRLVVSKQTSWLQSLVVKEELLLGKLEDQATALKVEHMQHADTKAALSSQAAAAARLSEDLRDRDAVIERLKTSHQALQMDFHEHKGEHARLQQHFQKSNKLLNDARAAITEYEQTVKIIENQLADSDKHKPKPFAADALKLTEQEQELAALRAEVAALKRVQRPSAVIRPAQDASQTHIQHLPPPEGGSSQQRSIRDCAPPALGAPDQHATPCRPRGMPLLLAAMPPAQAQVSASGATELSIPSQPVALQPSCANKHTALGKRDISGGLSSRQESWLQPAADTADELEVLSDNPSPETKHLHPVKRPCSQPDPGSSGDSPHSRPARSESWSAGEQGAQAKRSPGAAAGKHSLLQRSSPGPSSNTHSTIPSAATVPQNGGPAYEQARSTDLTGSVGKQDSIGMQNAEAEDSSSKRGGGQGGTADRQSNQEALVHGQESGNVLDAKGNPNGRQVDVFDAFAAFEGLGSHE